VSTELVVYAGHGNEKVRFWTSLSRGERLRRATAAAAVHDAGVLWDLTEAHLRAFGRAGGHVSARTLAIYRTATTRLVAEWVGVKLTEATRDDGAGWLNGLTASGMKPASVMVYLAAARRFYEALRWSGATAADPFADLRAPKDTVPKTEKAKPYSAKAVRSLMEQADPYERVLIRLCCDAGLRLFEAQALRWDDIDLEASTLYVRLGKGRKPRTVGVSPALHGELTRLRATSDGAAYLFPWRSTRWSQRRIERLAEKAGVEHLGIHAMRHTAGARMWTSSQSLEVTGMFLGHASLEPTRIYAHMTDERPRKIVSEWTEED